MSTSKTCQCDCPSFTMVPVRGCLAMDTSDFGTNLPLVPDALYVNATSGDDANDGLTPNTAFKTINAAKIAFESYPLVGVDFAIYVAAGTYPENLSVDSFGGKSYLRFVGDSQNYPVIEGETHSSFNALASFQFFHFKGPSQGVIATNCGVIRLFDCRITTVGISQESALFASFGGLIDVRNSLVIDCTSGSLYALRSLDNASIRLDGTSRMTINGMVTRETVHAARGGLIRTFPATSVTGTVTGKRYLATTNGIIYVTNGDGNFFPGTTAGTTAQGGLYTA